MVTMCCRWCLGGSGVGCGGSVVGVRRCERDRRVALPADGDLPAQVLGTPRFAEPIFPADSPVVIVPFGVEVDAARLKRHVATTRVESPGGTRGPSRQCARGVDAGT